MSKKVYDSLFLFQGLQLSICPESAGFWSSLEAMACWLVWEDQVDSLSLALRHTCLSMSFSRWAASEYWFCAHFVF